MDGLPDHDLMARAAKGDERAFRTLSERHAGAALRLARRILGNEAAAEDIVQDALLRVWVNAPRWRPEAAVRTWLYRIVVNLCLNARRRAPDLPLETAGDVGSQLGGRRTTQVTRTGPSSRGCNRRAAAASARCRRAHLSGRAQQRGGRRSARHFRLRRRNLAGPCATDAARCIRVRSELGDPH